MSHPTNEPHDFITMIDQPPSRMISVKTENEHYLDDYANDDKDDGAVDGEDKNGDEDITNDDGDDSAEAGALATLSQASSTSVVECDPPLQFANKNGQYMTIKHCP